jgi:putative hydroxymethylpyrimidine transport system substrate-binding protein
MTGRRNRFSVGVLLAALALTGCGSTGAPRADDEPASLLLDFQPNGVHAGIYTAHARGFDEGEGLRLQIRVPGESSDAVRLLEAGRVDFAVLDIHDLALAREKGADLVGVYALVEKPLAALMTQPAVRRPSELAGKRVGVTGLPSDDAVLRSVVEHDGGDVSKVEKVTIGFSAVRSLLTRRVAGATAFWDVEGLELKAQRPGVHEFRVDDYGAPSYPELVVAATRETLDERPTLVASLRRALRRGYETTLDDPEGSAGDLAAAVPGTDRAQIGRQLDAIGPDFAGPGGRLGVLDRATLEAWARWEQAFGLVRKRPDVLQAFELG